MKTSIAEHIRTIKEKFLCLHLTKEDAAALHLYLVQAQCNLQGRLVRKEPVVVELYEKCRNYVEHGNLESTVVSSM